MGLYVRSEDVRGLLRLVGEARELLDAGECARPHVLEGLSRLTGSSVGCAMSASGVDANAPPEVQDYLDHGWTAGERGRVLSYYAAVPAGRDPMVGRILHAPAREPLVTLRRSDLVENGPWYGSRLHNELHRPGGLDDVLLSMRFLPGAGGRASLLVFKRGTGDRPFSEEDRELLHLFRSESDWMFRWQRPARATQPVPEGLTRREQETLTLLLTDASEKVMAARLGISPHTVHDYVKRLYRKIGVTSRAALMARCADAPPRHRGAA